MLKIVQAPKPVLSQEAKPIGVIDKSVHRLIKEMEQTLLHATDPEGVGLAAPQVGKSLQLFIVRQTPRSPILVFINPVIEKLIHAKKEEPEEKTSAKGGSASGRKGVQLEGCLSLKDIWGVVKRADSVVVSYQDEKGTQHKKTVDGFLATIIQHECDHLDGILFPKRVLEQHNQMYHSVKNAEGEIEFEEIEI